MFHNVLMTSLTPLRDTNEVHGWDNRPFNSIWPESKQEKNKDTSIKKTIKKKNKRYRTMFTTEQVRELEKVFVRSKYIDVERRREIAECLQIDQKCIKIWFQNRRMKEKKELSESCESASEDVAESVSPALEASQPLNHIQNSPCLQYDADQSQVKPLQYNHFAPNNYQNARPSQCYYYAQNNYLNVESPQIEPSNYELPNDTVSSESGNFINLDAHEYGNNASYSSQYYPADTIYKYYYNMGYINDQYTGSNVQDWPVNYFDTSYL